MFHKGFMAGEMSHNLLVTTLYSNLHDLRACNQVLFANFQITAASCLLYKADVRVAITRNV